jgi:hypothetical protein
MEACAMGGNKKLHKFCFRLPAAFAAAALTISAWSAESTVKSLVPNFQTSDRCVACHNGLSTRAGEDISIGLAWRPTMMANAARDPYWHAGVRRETIDHPESRAAIEDECSICHMPMARFESKQGGHEGVIFSHLGFLPDDRGDQLAADGVSCSMCHQIGKENLGTRESFVGKFVIGGPNVQGNRLIFGPYAPNAGHIRIMRSSTGGFVPTEAAHVRESELCATCHTLITQALGPGGKEISEFPEQVPYQEWLHSEYKQKRSCQSCHMPVIEEDVAVTSLLGVARKGASRHTFVGGNFLMKGILNRYRNELSVGSLPDELSADATRTKNHLESEAARISIGKLEERNGRLEGEVTVENFGGHKLPTAYPSRRVWLHLTVRDSNNRTVFESGAVNSEGAIADNDNDADAARFEPHYAEIRSPGQVQIYEAIMADSAGSVTTGLLHSVRYLKDNRLLPHGFDKKTAGADIAVAGGAMEDADFSSGTDRVRYSMELGGAQGPFKVEAELCYQPISYRWAMNLKKYNAEEPQRFVRYYESAASAATVVLAHARAEFR